MKPDRPLQPTSDGVSAAECLPPNPEDQIIICSRRRPVRS